MATPTIKKESFFEYNYVRKKKNWVVNSFRSLNFFVLWMRPIVRLSKIPKGGFNKDVLIFFGSTPGGGGKIFDIFKDF